MQHPYFLTLGVLLVTHPGCQKRAEEPVRAPIVGTVLSPNGDGVDVVPGASVRIEGRAEVETDERGQFVLPPVPIGTPVRVLVEGPRTLDPDAPERFGTQVLTVTVPDEAGVAVYPHILRACAGIVPAGGGEVADDACAGGGGISVTFGPDAFDRPVEVEMVSLDPDAPGDVLGLPSDGLGAEGPPIVGGMEIHLRDADTGEPVAMADGARATLLLELAALPDDIPDDDLVFEFYDEVRGVYHEPHPVTVVERDGRRFGEVTVRHFSRARVAPGYTPRLTECVTFATEVCRPSGRCDNSVPHVQVLDLGLRRSFVPDLRRADGEVCIPLRASASNEITFRYADALATTLLEEPVYQAKVYYDTPPQQAPNFTPTCPDSCVPLNGGRVIQLNPLPYGCVRAQFFSVGGDPVVGPIRVSIDGNHVSSAIIPGPGVCTPECGNEFCVQVPIFQSQAVEIEGASGANLQFVPDPTTAGQRCPRTRALPCGYCDGAGTCQDLGAIVSDCDTAYHPDNPCLQAEFDIIATPDAGGCTGDDNVQLVLDATGSTGFIPRYEWTVDRLDGVDPVDGRQITSDPVADPICIASGEYRIQLDAHEGGRSWRRSRRERVVTLGEAHPGPCSEVRTTDLLAPTPTVLETCTYTWDGRTPQSLDCAYPSADVRRSFDLVPDCGFPCILQLFPPQTPGIGVTRTREARPASGPFDIETTQVLDALGNVTRRTTVTPGGTDVRHVVYDDAARPTRVEDRLDQGGVPGDLVGVYALTWEGSRVVEVTYDDQGNGTIDSSVAYTHEGGRLTHSALSAGVLSTAFHYAYDEAGNLRTLTQDDAGGTPVSQRTFRYDCW
ncbi:MAG: carboxypeptidase-like regulatory domain-containing protein [Myxococcota bacterium]